MSVILQRLLAILAGTAIVFSFFFGTLLILRHFDSRARDQTRIEHIKLLKSALERYRQDHASYPTPFLDNPVDDLKPALVAGGYLTAIPVDPLRGDTGWQYRYVSAGNGYGLLLHLEVPSFPSAEGTCLTGVGTSGTGWWGQQPDCPF